MPGEFTTSLLGAKESLEKAEICHVFGDYLATARCVASDPRVHSGYKALSAMKPSIPSLIILLK